MPEDNQEEMEMLRALEADVRRGGGPGFDVNSAFAELDDADKEELRALKASEPPAPEQPKTFSAKLADGTEITGASEAEVIEQLTARLAEPAAKPGLVNPPGFAPPGSAPPAPAPAAAPPEDAPKLDAAKWVETFFQRPEDAIAEAVDVSYGRKGALKQLAEATGRVERLERQLKHREAVAFIRDTPDYPAEDQQLGAFLGGLITQNNMDFTRENLAAAWKYAKDQGWVRGKPVAAEPPPAAPAPAPAPSPTPARAVTPPPVAPGTNGAPGRTGAIGGAGNSVLAKLEQMADDPNLSMDDFDAAVRRAGLDQPGSVQRFEAVN